jgi:hypothetical protein
LEDKGIGGKMGSEWILGKMAWGCGLDSSGSGQGPVAGCCVCGDEPSGSCATELVSFEILANIRNYASVVIYVLTSFYPGTEEFWLRQHNNNGVLDAHEDFHAFSSRKETHF